MKNTGQVANQLGRRVVFNRLLKRVNVGTCREKPPVAREDNRLDGFVLQGVVDGFGNAGKKGHGKRLRGRFARHFYDANSAIKFGFNPHVQASQFDVDVLDFRVKAEGVLTLLDANP